MLAEQGLIGLRRYVASIVVGALDDGRPGSGPTGRRAAPPYGPPPAARRGAVLAAFVALLVHTMAYAGFFEDPITWVLLAVGVPRGLAARGARRRRPAAVRDPA